MSNELVLCPHGAVMVCGEAQCHDCGSYAQKDLEEARAKIVALEAKVAELTKKSNIDADYAQQAVDGICHYRNLAIILGAKPDNMLGKFDRKLCKDGIDKDDTGNGYHISVQELLDETESHWADLDKVETELAVVMAALEKINGYAKHNGANSKETLMSWIREVTKPILKE